MDGPELDAYLARIGAARPARADATALRELQLRHLRTVPFENLSIHLGEPIVLEPGALLDKLLRRRRGGFCYELNGAFSDLLSSLGFGVTLLAARVFGDDGPSRPARRRRRLRSVARRRRLRPPQQLPPAARLPRRAGRPRRDLPHRRDPRRRPGRHQGRPAAVPPRATPPLARRLRADLLVAADLAQIPLHPVPRLLPAHRARPRHPQRPDPHPDDRRAPGRAHPDRRRRGARRLPDLVRHRP
jgi:hypothetical protein